MKKFWKKAVVSLTSLGLSAAALGGISVLKDKATKSWVEIDGEPEEENSEDSSDEE